MRKSYLICGVLVGVLGFAAAASAQQVITGLTLSATSVEAGEQVSGTATGSPTCGAVHFDWGDGTAITYPTETLPVTRTHVYQSGGTFDVRVQGMGSCTGEARGRITVKGPPAPPAALARLVGPEVPVEPRTPVAFRLEGTASCAVRLEFGDGNGQDVTGALPQTVRHTYDAPGRYTVVASPKAPCTGRQTANVDVKAPAPEPPTAGEISGISVDRPQRAREGERAITVHGTGPCTYDLEVGDGNRYARAATLPDVVRHHYTKPGRYTAVATARLPCRGTLEWTFNVQQRPIGEGNEGRISGIRARPLTVAAGQDVTIAIDGSGSCRFVVDFHDGESRTLTQRLPYRLTYRYGRPGEYTIVVWAHEPCLGQDEVTVRVGRR